ncbi:hypothetical protein SDC9_44756 [bioreactor metagenome]|uniref:50S ribosomal protein L28 n=1 Tax=bioreactor metagenome TaxID=1076179 RepID=A0A644W526_9ZZZZ|nr:hypothetical protein [Sphaerochaeta sp.]
MSKAHRGSGIRSEVNHGRGQCPVCKRTEVKVMYEVTIEGQKTKVCKPCNAHLKAVAAN